MYHSISKNSENGIHPYYRINTSPDIFAEHMRFINENNYSVTTLLDVKNHIESGIKITNKYVVITFDDGYCDFYTEAFPVLQKYGFTATVFLPTGFVSKKGLKFKENETLTWNQVRELNNNGISFGSHTVTHPQLKSLRKEDIRHEIIHSKEVIEDKLGESIRAFSYPFAFPDEDNGFMTFLRDVLQESRYDCGVTTRIGTTSMKDDIYFLKRIPINSLDNKKLLNAKLNGYYDWCYYVQLVSKIISAKLKN